MTSALECHEGPFASTPSLNNFDKDFVACVEFLYINEIFKG